MLAQKSLALTLILSVLFCPPYVFVCSWMPPQESEIFHNKESIFFSAWVSLLTSEVNQTEGGKEFIITKGTV